MQCLLVLQRLTGRSECLIELNTSVQPGDFFVSIAYQFVELVPWIWLKERGVYRVMYSTDVGM